MDEHQRRMWGRMIDRVDAYGGGQVSLWTLADDLRGLFAAADIHDAQLVDDFYDRFAAIDGELELRTEGWASPGAADDVALARAVAGYRRWVQDVLATRGDEHE